MPETAHRKLSTALQAINDFEGFDGTIFGYPLLYGITAERHPDPEEIELALTQVKDQEGGYFIKALWLAELAESAEDDRVELFIGDDRFRSLCVGLNQGSNGWALLMGNGDTSSFSRLAQELSEKKLSLYSVGAATKTLNTTDFEVKSLGERETGVIYFGQLLMRYAIIYGMEPAGQAHDLAHSIEEHAPGVIFVLGELTDLESLLVQGMLSLGAPVVTTNSELGLVGHVYESDTITSIVERAWSLPNIRARLVEPATPDVPVPTGRIFTREKVDENNLGLSVVGSGSSFMIVKPSPDVREDGVWIVEKQGSDSGFSVLVELGNDAVDPPITLWVQAILRRVINYAKGVKVKSDGNGGLRFSVTKEAVDEGFELEHLGNLIQTELRNEFPKIGPIRVSFILDAQEEAALEPGIQSFVDERTRQIKEANEDSLEYFYGCTRCRSFSLAHACTVTPDRPAQCSKPWYQLKAYAVLSPNDVYDQCTLVEKGKCIDPIKGEYEGVNTSTESRTEGRVNRVFLHSIFEHPHTACSCFQNVVYHIPEVDGLAIMNRGYEGEAPNGMTWTKLANLVAGRQYEEGAATIATAYLHSKKFLKADGGYNRVVWMTNVLKKTAGNAIPEELRDAIATENEASTLDELKGFLASRGRM